MFTNEIEAIVKSNWRNEANKFLGVFPSDSIPKKPGFLIINNQSSDLAGEHWLGLYLNEKGVDEFFDSFALAPYHRSYPSAFEKTLRVPYIFNKIRLQSDRYATCGIYSIFYVLQRSNGKSLNQIINLFNKNNLESNDKYIIDWKCQLLGCSRPITNKIGQTCLPFENFKNKL